jgi:DNA-binding PadR family transcriptional regulator
LALLEERPSHGYQLKTSFEAATGGAWPLNVGQVYQTLERLERDGLVRSEEGDGLRSYALTSEGADELGSWWEASPADEPPPRDELMLKVLLAVSSGRDHALDVITSQRNAVMSRLQHHRRTHRPGAGTTAAAMVSDALVVRAEADLRWLDLCEERLVAEPAPRQTPRTKRTRGARQ